MSPKPPFLSPGNFNELPLVPPFAFQGMTTSILPLRANIVTLQRLLDRYINFVPPQVGRFRAALPYVYLMVIDYGKLALEATNLGWFSQTEIVFTFPASHYTFCEGSWVYQGIAWFSPFIFVDSDTSLTLGRRVYGWTKLRQTMTHGSSKWVADPSGTQSLATLETPIFAELYADKLQQSQVFCEIMQMPDRSGEFPPDTAGAWFPWTMAKNVTDSLLGTGRDAAQTLTGMRGMPASPEVFFASAMDSFGLINPMNPDTGFTTFNLKQFRDSGRPELFCYQALTCASMRVTNFNRMASLTDMRGFGTDPSGGLRVRLHRWPTLPIVDSLGLVPDRSWRGDGAQVVELEPVNPFWYNVDMLYERGRNLAERSHDGVWRTPHGRYQHASRVRPTALATSDKRRGPRLDVPDALFNTTLGASTQTVAGPFDALDSNMQVFPLLADPAKLQQFLDDYLNTPLTSLGLRFEPWAPVRFPAKTDQTEPTRSPAVARCAYVYLTILDWGPVRSGTDDIGNWKGEELSVFIPVRWYRGDELIGAGLVPAITYASSTAAMISNAEVLGWPARKAVFQRPEVQWVDDPSEVQRKLLCIHTEVLPTMSQGQPICARQVLEVSHTGRLDEQTRQQWAQAFEVERARKQAMGDALDARKLDLECAKKFEQARDVATLLEGRTLARDFLVNDAPIGIYSIKQFRDVREPQNACYQSLSRVRRSLRVKQMDRLPDALALKISEYESNPMVELFGLETTLVRTEQDRHEYWVKPVHPFFVEMSLREQLGECLYYRDLADGANQGWRPGPDGKNLSSYFIKDEVERRRLDPVLARQIDNGAPLMTKATDFPTKEDYRTGLPFVLLIAKKKMPLQELGHYWTIIRELRMAIVIEGLEAALDESVAMWGMMYEVEGNVGGRMTHAMAEEVVYEVSKAIGYTWTDVYDHMKASATNLALKIFKRIDGSPKTTPGNDVTAPVAVIAQILTEKDAGPDDVSTERKARVVRRTLSDWLYRKMTATTDLPTWQQAKQVCINAINWVMQKHKNAGLLGYALNVDTQVGWDFKLDARPSQQAPVAGSNPDSGRALSTLGLLIDDVADRRLTHEVARDVIRRVDPQMVIESMLSRDWGSSMGGSPRRAFQKQFLQRYQSNRQGYREQRKYDSSFISEELAKFEKLNGVLEDHFPFSLSRWSIWCDTVVDLHRIAEESGVLEETEIGFAYKEIEKNMYLISVRHPFNGDFTDAELMKNVAVAGISGTLRHVFDAFANLKLGGARLDALRAIEPSKERLGSFVHDAKRPGGWLHGLLMAARAAYEAEVERMFELIASYYCDPDFFVPKSLLPKDSDP